MKMIYLAGPYTLKTKFKLLDKLIMWLRFRRLTFVAGCIMTNGVNVFSPITHSHSIATIAGLPQLEQDFWLELDKWYVERCDAVAVHDMRGWDKSVGVKREIRWAKEMGKEIVFVNKYGEIKRRL